MLTAIKRYLILYANNIVMLILLTIVFVLLACLSNKHSFDYDLTYNKRHTISQVSIDLLAKMPEAIEIISYARENKLLRDEVIKFVNKYKRYKSNITLRFINPDAVPNEVRELGISVDGEIIIYYQGRREHVRSDSEQVFTNALQRLVRKNKHLIGFISGHGERDILGKANFDLSNWAKKLADTGYLFQVINLSETHDIPHNTKILVIASPRTNYLPGELDIITKYLENGGNLLWLHDPNSLFNLKILEEKFSIDFQDGSVMDVAGKLIGINNPSIALVTNSLYPPHIITKDFNLTTLYPAANAIDIKATDAWEIKPLLVTGSHTWTEKNYLKKDDIQFDEGVDKKGPLNIALTLEREIKNTTPDGGLHYKQQRIVIVGDGDFLSNTYLANSGNNELGNRIINWLSNDEELIDIPPKIATDTQINISNITLGIIAVGFLLILPITLIIAGIVISSLRKKK